MNKKLEKMFDEKWYNDFNHINALRQVDSNDCEKSFDLQEVEDWVKSFIDKHFIAKSDVSLTKAMRKQMEKLK